MYNSYSSQHVAFTKKAGTYSYYFRKSDTGASEGPNLATLFEVRDNGDTWNPGAAYCGLGYVLNDYAQTRWTTGSGKGWRALTESNGNNHGFFIIQGSADGFQTSFINPLILGTNGSVQVPNWLEVGSYIEVNKFNTVASPGWIDISAQPGSDADARLYREAGGNGSFIIQNGGTGNLGFYAGGTAGQPWTANKGFHINGSSGTLYLTNGLAFENSQSLNFRDTAGGYGSMICQSDNNWVFYGTNSTGGARAIASCFMRSDTSVFHLIVPLWVQGQPVGGSGSIVKTVYAESDALATMTAVIPVDDTAPQITEGTQILSAAITTSANYNKIQVRVSLHGSVNAASTITVAVFFQGFGLDAYHALGTTVPTANYAVNMNCEFTLSAGLAGTYTCYVRVGSNSGTLTLNGANGVRRYGGKAKCSLVLEEIRA